MTRRATRDPQGATKVCSSGADEPQVAVHEADVAAEAPAPRAALTSPVQNGTVGLIPAAAFAALVGRTLRTLRAWDQAGLIHPVMIRRRRYYRASDLASLVAHGDSRRGPRVGSPIKYLEAAWDNGS